MLQLSCLQLVSADRSPPQMTASAFWNSARCPGFNQGFDENEGLRLQSKELSSEWSGHGSPNANTSNNYILCFIFNPISSGSCPHVLWVAGIFHKEGLWEDTDGKGRLPYIFLCLVRLEAEQTHAPVWSVCYRPGNIISLGFWKKRCAAWRHCWPPLAPSKVPAPLLKLPSPLICNGLSLGKLLPCSFYVSWVILSLLCKMSQKKTKQREQGAEPGKPSATNKEQNSNCSWSPKHLLPSAGAEWEKKKLQFTHKEHIWFPLLDFHQDEISFLCVCEKQLLQGRNSPQGRELTIAMFPQ